MGAVFTRLAIRVFALPAETLLRAGAAAPGGSWDAADALAPPPPDAAERSAREVLLERRELLLSDDNDAA